MGEPEASDPDYPPEVDDIAVWSNRMVGRSVWSEIDEATRNAIYWYVIAGRVPGHFVRALMSNDLLRTVARADPDNLRLLPRIVRLIASATPLECWGSSQAVDRWIEMGGLVGKAADAAVSS